MAAVMITRNEAEPRHNKMFPFCSRQNIQSLQLSPHQKPVDHPENGAAAMDIACLTPSPDQELVASRSLTPRSSPVTGRDHPIDDRQARLGGEMRWPLA
jgi:hypothetical protein